MNLDDEQAKALQLASESRHSLFSLKAYDDLEVFPKISNRKLRGAEECIAGFYLRSRGAVAALLKLDNVSDVDVQTGAARTVFELVTDALLVDKVESADTRIRAFAEYDRILATEAISKEETRLAYRGIEQAPFDAILLNKERAFAQMQELFPKWNGRTTIRHWSGTDLRTRSETCSKQLEQIYIMGHKRLSWGAHGGLVHILGLPPAFLSNLSGFSFATTLECFGLLLRHIVVRLRLVDEDPLLIAKHHYAVGLSMLDEADVVGDLTLRAHLGL